MKNSTLKDYFMIAIGSALVAAALHFFYFPANLAAGGISGIAIIINYFMPAISKATLVFVFNIVFFAIGFATLGAKFGAKTIFSSFFTTFVLWVFQKTPGNIVLTNDLFLNTFYGTLIASVGMAMVFSYGASTGGTDIPAKIINKYFNVDVGKALMAVDFTITACGFLVFGPEVGLFSLVSVIFNGPLIDRLLDGLNSAKEIMIISKKSNEIRGFILGTLDRGCTVLKGYGGFTKDNVDVIYVVLDRSDYIQLKKYIRTIDKRAFLSVNEVREVLGEGYQDINAV